MAVRNDPQLKFRIPGEMKVRLEASARGHRRSMNMEVVARLERLFELEDALASKVPGKDEFRGELAVARLLEMSSVKSGSGALDRLMEIGTNPQDVENRLRALEHRMNELTAPKRK